MVAHAVENQVIPLPTGCEIFTGVINDLIRTDGSNHIHIARTAYASDLRTEGLGNTAAGIIFWKLPLPSGWTANLDGQT